MKKHRIFSFFLSGICEKVLGEKIGITTLPRDGEQMIELRRRINEKIKEAKK